jgi:hypothetical protein
MDNHQNSDVKITFSNLPSPVNSYSSGPVPTDTLLLPPEYDISPEKAKLLVSEWASKVTPQKNEPFGYVTIDEQRKANANIAKISGREYMKKLDQINDVIKDHVANRPNYPENSATDEELDRAAESTRNYEKQNSESLRQQNSKRFYKAIEDDKATTQFAKETGMSDAQVYDTIKANEESIAGDKKVVWVSAVIADEIQHRIEKLKKAFTSMVESESGCFTDRDKVKITDNCDALIAVDPIMLELFIKTFKYDAKRSEDLIACIPEKPVEVPTHPEHNVTSGHRLSEPASGKACGSGKAGGDAVDAIASEDHAGQTAGEQAVQTAKKNSIEEWNKTYGDPNASEFKAKNEEPIECNSWEKAKLKYDCGEFKLTPDGVDSVLKGHTPVLDAWHVGQDPLGPAVTPEQWFNSVKATEDANKSFKIPGATPHDPSKVKWFTDDYKRLDTAKSTPTPPPNKPTAWTADGHPFDIGHNYGRPEPSKVEKKAPLIPKVYDVPKDMVDMIEKLPNDLWRYNVVQDENAIKLTLNYDARPRHIHIIVNTGDEEVTINTNREFRGSYSTTLSWDSHAADDSLCPNRQRLFIWLRAWIKDIME